MNEEYFEKHGFENQNQNPEESKSEAAEAEAEQTYAAAGEYTGAEATETDKATASFENSYDSAQQVAADVHTEEKTTENVYSDSSYNTQAGAASYTNPYSGYYQQPSPYQTRQTPPYGDGYYHRSFAGDNSGNNVNYTSPYSANSYTAPRQPQNVQTHQPRVKADKKGLTKGGIAILLVVCLLISAAAGFGGSLLAQNLNKQQYDSAGGNTMVIHKVSAENQVAGTETLVDKGTDEIAADVADSVVEITTEVMQTNSFYGQYIAQGAGSGVIISSDGYILTNNHVIDGASSIKVTTKSGDSYDATLVGTDSEVDIALIKIDAADLPTAVFGDSDTLAVGDKAVIIGNPLGTLGGSVTEGIISALDRSIVIDGKTMHLMQTDAAINPGNSGGGMFNGQGELAGIVVAKSSSSSESIDNIGFVIPINTVLNILGDLKDYGYVRGRASTGMSFIDLTNQMYAWYYYGNSSAGVYISSVDSGSNAYAAGFRQGDRVISVDGKEITSSTDIDTIIAEKSAGDTVTFELERSGSKGTLELTLEEYIPESVQSKSSAQNSNPFSNGFNR